jgi:hypothetical protein
LVFCSLAAATCSAATLVTPDITITGLTHTFGHFAPGGPTTSISDSVVAGQFTQTGFTATLTGSELVVSRFGAAPREKFVVRAPPAGFGNISLTVIGEWVAGSDFGRTPISNTAVFYNLAGPAPVLTSSQNVIGAGGKWVRSYAVFTVAPGTEFTGVQVSAQFASSIANPASRVFTPQTVKFSAAVSSSQSLSDGPLLTMESVPLPTMGTQRSGTGFVVSWPTNFDSWVLESTTQFGSTNNWSVVTNARVILGTNFAVTNMDMAPVRYYRLKSQ